MPVDLLYRIVDFLNRLVKDADPRSTSASQGVSRRKEECNCPHRRMSEVLVGVWEALLSRPF